MSAERNNDHSIPFPDGAADGGAQTVTAYIPLKVDDASIGAIVIFDLLGHKLSLAPVDHELFDLLAMHASTALYCASLHAKAAAVAA